MGMGVSIEAVTIEWPQEVVRVRCPTCGSIFDITRYKRMEERLLPPEIAVQETEQVCPLDGTPLCGEEKQVKSIGTKRENPDFFSLFKNG